MLVRAGAFMIFVAEYPTTSLILIKTKMKYTETHQIQLIKPLLIVKNILFDVYNRKKVVFFLSVSFFPYAIIRLNTILKNNKGQ